MLILLRADNNGEGGTLTLMALAQRALGRSTPVLFLLGTISGALFYGDAVITPALSVLSAVEGLKIATPAFEPYIVPLTVVILVALFAVQSRGTAQVAAFFGPITLVWFIAIAIAGLYQIAADARRSCTHSILACRELPWQPRYIGLITLGAVFLAVTGTEALYADLGHFGRHPIQFAWLVLVLPALVLNYLGQGALVLANPKAIENPFFLLYPDWALLPMVVLATAATVIASQAVITGAYSLTRQAIQLGLLPRLEIRHTSETQVGQIYMPRVNTLLLVGVLLLVALFRSSSALASAYGIAVTGTMVVTAMMAFIVISKGWKWSPWAAAALIAPFLLIDLVFLGANMLKIHEGGWMPLALGGVVMLVMYTWRRGSRLLFDKTRKHETALRGLVAMLEKKAPTRVPGTAVFLTSDPTSAPTALMHSLKHYKVLHEKNVILTVETADTPHGEDRRSAFRSSRSATASPASRCISAIWRRRMCRRRLRSRVSSAGSSTSCRRRSSCRAARSNPQRNPACRAGRTGCSSSSRAAPTTPPTISRSRRGGWSRLERRSRYSGRHCGLPVHTIRTGKRIVA